MSPERWQQISTLLSDALDQPPEDRDAFLDAACDGDDALRAEVEALLQAAPGADQYFDDLADKALLPLTPLLAANLDPTATVGPYRILEAIGQGGMGQVFLAERADGQFEQQVALKIIKRGLDTDRVRQRFLRERQILARLHHPHIAKLLDGGITNDGRPFFVMEYVDGAPLTTYCNQNHLTIDARLSLFIEVGRAVQYAHRNLIVHRDLKPSNILVKEDDTGTPHVKLLDFGIAKLLEADDANLALTQTGLQVMTPAYAAPEQVTGDPVTTATDVYALGLLLYELLVGSLPHQATGTAALAQAITDSEPPRPSTLVQQSRTVRRADGSTETITPDAISAARRMSTTALRRRLAGDLDVIVLAALRKEPERRYASVDALLEDVQRHLHGLPITARPDTMRYRVGKFIQRHRWGVGTAAVMALTVLLGFATTLWQARIAATERDAAQQQAARAEEVTEFLIGIFEMADPSAVMGDTLSAREILAEGIERVQQDLQNQPETQAQLLDAMGRVYMSMGETDQAAPLLEQALTLKQSLYAAPHPQIAEAFQHLGTLRHNQGRFEDAEQMYRQSLDMYHVLVGPSHPDIAQSMNRLGRMQLNKGNLAAADSLLTTALTMQRATLGTVHPDIATTLNDLGLVRNNQNRHDDAERLYREALAMHQQLHGAESPNVAGTMNNLTVSLMNQKRYAEAEAVGRQALVLRKKLHGPEHPSVARITNTLAVLLMNQQKNAAADSFFVTTLALREHLYGTEHPSYAAALYNRAVLRTRMEDYATAETVYREVLRLREQAYGPVHIRVGVTLLGLGVTLKQQGRLTDAEAAYRRALSIFQATYDAPHRNVGNAQVGLGEIAFRRGHYTEAVAVLREALVTLVPAYGEDHLQTVYARSVLGASLVPLGQYEEAEMLLQAAYPILQNQRGDTYWLTQLTRQALHDLYVAWNKGELAIPFTASSDSTP